MSGTAPPVDSRTAADIARQVRALLHAYIPARYPAPGHTAEPAGMTAALTGVFARFAELIIQRLNLAPDKNQLAFLDMLGATPMPPVPARVPLTFSLAAGASGAVVPARTRVAAPPAPGGKAPVPFETEDELTLTPATLARVVTWDAPSDRFADHGRVASPGNTLPVILFQGDTPVVHMFAVSLDALLGFGAFTEMTVHVDLAQNLAAGSDPRAVEWEIQDGATVIPLTPLAPQGTPPDGTAALTQSGDVWFVEQQIAPQAGFTPGRRLRARLLTPVTRGPAAVTGQVRAAQLPAVTGVAISANGYCGPFLPDAAFAESLPLDVSRDFYPFGQKPQFGATWYIASQAVLSRADHRISVVAQFSDANGVPVAIGTPTLVLVWEFWDGQAWSTLGRSGPGVPAGSAGDPFGDPTSAFTKGGSSEISFLYPRPPQPTVVNGVSGYWLRVRLAAGGYTANGPSLASVTLSFGNNRDTAGLRIPADTLIAYDGMLDAPAKPPLAAFAPAADAGRSLYLGLSLPPALAGFPQVPVSFYAELEDLPFGFPPDNQGGGGAPRLAWAYWNGQEWAPLVVSDASAALTTSGTIAFLPPPDFAAGRLFGQDGLYWLRATWRDGVYTLLPRLRRLLLNTVMGEQAVTVRGDVLGSATGQASQQASATQTPILAGVALDVTEGELPAAAERAGIIAAEGPGAIVPLGSGAVRVRWHEVNDFYASGPRDRHYVIDHLTGQVTFGDGINGMIPPAGAGNLVLSSYRTGGGDAGNVPAATIRQLKTTVPYVSAVTNPAAATGGVGAETMAALRIRAPRTVRHGGRAVTAADYEDIARLASPEVARVLAVPLLNLTADPDGRTPKPGSVSVIIVPRSDALRPFPSLGLVAAVLDRLQAGALPGLDLVVVGPEYVSVDVHAELSLTRLDAAGAVEAAALAALAGFLNPLTGGPDSAGWGFGRRPFRSDIVALLQGIPGVDYLRLLDIAEVPDRAGTEATGRFLVCSGSHRIDLVFGE
jgi:hypothetical protein